MFTVFTPAYNRASLLQRPYRSLCDQTLRDFEWLIVDDGSTDGTEAVVAGFRADADFPIRYLYQTNQGKHAAFNLGVQEARGSFFLTLDSDDRCVPTALERLAAIWEEIPPAGRAAFSGVSVLCMDEEGRTVGTPYREDRLDADPIAVVSQGMVGERWGFHRTEVLRQYPFPRFPGEKFVTEAVVWNRIARRFRIRYANEALRVYYATPGGLSDGLRGGRARNNWALRARNPRGARLYYQEAMSLPYSLPWMLKNTANYVRFSFHAGEPLWRTIAESPRPVVALATAPLGAAVYVRDRLALVRAKTNPQLPAASGPAGETA